MPYFCCVLPFTRSYRNAYCMHRLNIQFAFAEALPDRQQKSRIKERRAVKTRWKKLKNLLHCIILCLFEPFGRFRCGMHTIFVAETDQIFA